MSASSDKNQGNEKKLSYRAQKKERERQIEELIRDALEKSELDLSDVESRGSSSFDGEDARFSDIGTDKNFDSGSIGSDFRSPKGEKKSLSERKKDAINKVQALKNTGKNVRNLPNNVSARAQEVKKRAAAAKEQAEKLRKMSKDDMNRMAKRQLALKKAALKKQLAQKAVNMKKKLKKKLSVNAKYGKSPYMSCLFMLMLLLAAFNDIFLDLFVGGTVELISLIISLTGIGAAVGGPLIAIVETAGSVLDIITGIILIAFSLITGGVTKSSLGKKVSSLVRLVCGVGIEQIPIVNLFVTWMVVIAINWYIMRKDATKAEEMG